MVREEAYQLIAYIHYHLSTLHWHCSAWQDDHAETYRVYLFHAYSGTALDGKHWLFHSPKEWALFRLGNIVPS